MATNPYITQAFAPEQNLYEDLIIESIQFYGQDLKYMPRESVDIDAIWADETSARFDNAFDVEMYLEDVDGFDGEGDLFTKFGIEIRDVVHLVVARKRWYAEVRNHMLAADSAGGPGQGHQHHGSDHSHPTPGWADSDTSYRPREGDLIFVPFSKNLFQIMKVEDETPFYQLKNLPVFRLTCELFEYSNEDFNTGVQDIDNIEKAFSYQYRLVMDPSATGYIVGERVSQVDSDSGYTLRAEVVDWIDSSNNLYLAHVGANDGNYHSFATTLPVVGDSSGASFNPVSVYEFNGIHETNQNQAFESEAADFLSFDESNPFGDL